VLTGKGRELLKLRTFPRVINLAVPDTFSGSVWHTALRSSDVDVPKGVDVEVARVIPEEIELTLDSVAHKDVPIIPRVSVVPDSGQVLRGGLSLTPGVAHLVGSDRSLATIESVMTVPTRLTGLSGHFAQLVPVDTSPLGAVRIAPKQVEVAGEVGANFDRSFAGLLVESGAGALTGYSVTPARVSVSVRGPDSLVQVLTRERLKVIAHLRGADGWAKLTVIAPAGIVARAVPDSVNLKRKSGHD